MEGGLRYVDASNRIELCDDNVWGAVGATADSLDFSEFKDAMTLDASTSIAGSSTNALSITQSGSVAALTITNTGSGNSLLVEDATSTDTTPFVIDASGSVGIGSATPAVALDVVGAVSATGVATATGFAPTATTATGNRLYLPAANTLGLAINGSGEVQLTSAAMSPVTSDGNALGTTSLMWSDLFLASGAVVNFNNGDVTITHAADNLAIAGGTLTMGTAGGTNGQITLAGSTSGTVAVRAAATAGTSTIFQLPASNGTDGYVLKTDGSGVTSWVAPGTPSADSLNFTEFSDAMTLDASTSIAGTGTNALSITHSGSVAALRITNTGSGNSFLVEDAASTDGSPFVIKADGNVGIGTITPSAKLYVEEAAGGGTDVWIARFVSSTTNPGGVGIMVDNLESTNHQSYYMLAAGGNPTWYMGNSSNADTTDDFYIWQAGTGVHFTIDTAGYVGIGDTSPNHKLDVDGNIGLTASSYVNFGDTTGTSGYGFRDNAGTPQVKSSGGAWANIATTSDARLKQNIKPVTSALEAITKLQGVTFEWKDPNTGVGRKIGLIAQDVEKVYPEAITFYGNEKYRILDYAGLTGALVEAIKELKATNDNHAAEIQELKKEIAGLKSAVRHRP
jgi:hypothetical protein